MPVAAELARKDWSEAVAVGAPAAMITAVAVDEQRTARAAVRNRLVDDDVEGMRWGESSPAIEVIEKSPACPAPSVPRRSTGTDIKGWPGRTCFG